MWAFKEFWISQHEAASVWQMFDTRNPAGPLAEWNQDKSMQSCSGLGGSGDKGTESVFFLFFSYFDFLQELLARILSRSASACMKWQAADRPYECCIALRSPQMPHKEPVHKCSKNHRPQWMWWMPWLSWLEGNTATAFVRSVSRPQKPPPVTRW